MAHRNRCDRLRAQHEPKSSRSSTPPRSGRGSWPGDRRRDQRERAQVLVGAGRRRLGEPEDRQVGDRQPAKAGVVALERHPDRDAIAAPRSQVVALDHGPGRRASRAGAARRLPRTRASYGIHGALTASVVWSISQRTQRSARATFAHTIRRGRADRMGDVGDHGFASLVVDVIRGLAVSAGAVAGTTQIRCTRTTPTFSTTQTTPSCRSASGRPQYQQNR